MADEEQMTCGKGLAANSALPARLAQLMATRAEVLERHTKALDADDPVARREIETYAALVEAHRAVAAGLQGLAGQMAAARDLPIASHDMAVMTDPDGQAEAYQRYLALEQGVVELLSGGREG
ncbi:MAG: hypothetical protein IT429_00840 [Gemmataceae bacterium]|nr:hypothetical protein [Gemmataceae bacterium]